MEPTHTEKLIRSIGMVGRSEALADIARKVAVLRKHHRNILVLGESGTGKELVARALHGAVGDLRAVNCASYRANPTLLESALFGHVRGAFTGAAKDRKGVFEEARGGTVFLDEIHHLSADVQVSILRTIQEKRVTRIGSAIERPVQFKLVASAKPDLEPLVEAGNFRLDLYYRIKGATILIPPLRERPEDIEPLVQCFAKVWSQDNRTNKIFTASAIRHFERYGWPGNVRELENAVYEILDLVDSDKVTPENFPTGVLSLRSAPPDSWSLKNLVSEVERKHVQYVLGKSRSIREAARRMQISPQSLLRLLKKHAIHPKGNAPD